MKELNKKIADWSRNDADENEKSFLPLCVET